jgi:hypothetical protein
MEYAVKGLAGAIVTLAGLKALGTVVSLVSNLKGLKGVNIGAGLTGGAAMPVYVTNWGGGTPSTGADGQFKVPPTVPNNPLVSAQNSNNFTKGAKQAGVMYVAATAVEKTIGAYNEIKAVNANTEMSAKEKSKAKGGAVGDAVGATVGTAGGVLAGALLAGKIGAAIGTAVAPGVGTAIGGAIGMLGGAAVGWIGGKVGRKIGEGIGESLAADDSGTNQVTRRRGKGAGYIPVSDLPPQITQTGSSVAPQKVELGGQAVMDVNVNLSGVSPTASVTMRDNTTQFRFETGSRVAQRRNGI